MDELLSRLPEDFRTVLILRYLNGMKLREIADIMDTSISNIARMLNKAEKKALAQAESMGMEPQDLLQGE